MVQSNYCFKIKIRVYNSKESMWFEISLHLEYVGEEEMTLLVQIIINFYFIIKNGEIFRVVSISHKEGFLVCLAEKCEPLPWFIDKHLFRERLGVE